MRILVSVVLIVLAFAGDALAQSCASTQGQLEYCKALTNAVRFGFPRYTTALLPTCNTNNKGAVAFDTTATLVKYCSGSAWTSVGAGGGVSGLSTGVIPKAASATSLADSLLSESASGITLASGQLLLPAGTAALPSMSFGSSGMYLPGANLLGFSVTAGLRATLNSSSQFYPPFSGTGTIGVSTLRWSQGLWGGQTLTTTVTPLWDGSVTWNNSGTTHRLIYGNVTDTASAAASTLIDLQVASLSKFSVRKDGLLTLPSGGGASLGGTAFVTSTGNFYWSTRAVMTSPADGVWQAAKNAGGDLVRLKFSGAPSVAGSCGTSPSVAGQDTAMVITTGTVAPTSCAVTFQSTWTTAPVCTANAETTTTGINVVTTATTVTVSAAALTASEKIYVLCVGY